ncbi:MAG TPA: extracellular solute-binding protein [Stellaceae bacterium]|nr:extracellular solute-binding protein [Stellaceae bacterium]
MAGIERTGRARAFAALLLLLPAPAFAAPPAPAPVTPQLVAAAAAEGRVVFYTSIELRLAEKLGHAFEAAYPGIAVQVERSGAERIFQRIAQEEASGVRAADVAESSDIGHALAWKRQGLLAPYVPQDVAAWPSEARDADGMFAADRATLSVLGYNTRLVKPEDAPKSYADLLDAKWQGKIVKAHPGYSGTIMTATFEQVRALGWEYFAKLARQHVMQVQSATEPPRKLALGERPVMADGSEYVMFDMIAAGNPLAVVYPGEGTPLILGSAAVMKDAPHPSAARLFISFLFSRAGQQLMCDVGGVRSFHPEVKEPEGRVPLRSIKLITSDPLEQEKAIEEIKRKYAEYFGT